MATVHLIGDKKKPGKRTVKSIWKNTHCNVYVNFEPCDITPNDNHPLSPISISLTAIPGRYACRDLSNARCELQELLLDYVGNDGSKGRLVYEMASSHRGPHSPRNSTSGAVNVDNPFFGGGPKPWVTVLELPYEYKNGRKTHQTAYLMRSNLQTRLRQQTDCYITVVSEVFPVKLCDPYVFVVGGSFRAVDHAANIIQEETRILMQSNHCLLLR